MSENKFTQAAQAFKLRLEAVLPGAIFNLGPDVRENGDLGDGVVLTYQRPGGKITVYVGEYWAYPEDACFFVNVNDDRGGFTFNAGTNNPDRALVDVGAGIEHLNDVMLKDAPATPDETAEEEDAIGEALAYEAFSRLGQSHFEVSAHLNVDKPESIENYIAFRSMLVDAWKKGRSSIMTPAPEAGAVKRARPKH